MIISIAIADVDGIFAIDEETYGSPVFESW
jgi:hypothetical protein